MQAIRQSVRPKHQVLILKCYPRLPKNSSPAEIKPNGSELSYLLYYASSRRSKLSKVGAFLERRTASDLHKSRTSSVEITLQILTAFLNNPGIGSAGPGGLGLFAPYVLGILKNVLQSANDVALVEAAVSTWDSFCRHQDHVALSADAEYRGLFSTIVTLWAGYASKEKAGQKRLGGQRGHPALSVGDASRLRMAGLQALKSIADSETLGSEAGRQLETIVPVVLQNIDGTEADLQHLLLLDKENEQREKEQGYKRRQSMNPTRAPADGDSDAKAAGRTTAEADKLADDEAGVLALQCLKDVFEVENRGQIRTATACVLKYMMSKNYPSTQSQTGANPAAVSSWPTKLFETICNWTPVQDRFVAFFTAVETLIRSPMIESNLQSQLLLARAIAHVLRSDINLIGLSIMDILLGLLQHILLILQLGTTNTTLESKVDVASSDESLKGGLAQAGPVMEVVKSASPVRHQLLAEMRQCIASLATHIYYTDQISDMISAILLRLKPSPTAIQNPAVTASAIEDPAMAATEAASNASLRERPNTDGFFSFDTAREVALRAVTDIILVANSDQTDSSYVAENRNPVPISVWEGTQWLLRDACADVRQCYVDALCTWLNMETRKSDLRLSEGATAPDKEKKSRDGSLTRRAISNASARPRTIKTSRSTFLQLLHLAIYENAYDSAASSGPAADLLLLHLLLTTLTQKLGLNAVRHSLPMIFRLQDDIKDLSSLLARVRLGSLVHGYLWSLGETFDMEQTLLGKEVQKEIYRRRQQKLWVTGIQMPPVPIEHVKQAAAAEPVLETRSVTQDSLRPFTHREYIIDQMAAAYAGSIASPTPSAPSSPGRSFSMPVLSGEPSFLNSGSSRTHPLPQPVLDDLAAPWSKDSILAAIAARAPKSVSLSGSRSGASHRGRGQTVGAGSLLQNDHRHLLAAANTFPVRRTRTGSGEGSPRVSGTSLAQSPAAAAASHNHRAQAFSRYGGERRPSKSRSPASAGRRPSYVSSIGRQQSSSALGSTTGRAGGGGAARIEDLKKVLASGGTLLPASLSGVRSDEDVDTGSDSLVDVDDSFNSYGGYNTGPGSGYGREEDEDGREGRAGGFQDSSALSQTQQGPRGTESEGSDKFRTPPEGRTPALKTEGTPSTAAGHEAEAGTEVEAEGHLTGDASHDDAVLDRIFAQAEKRRSANELLSEENTAATTTAPLANGNLASATSSSSFSGQRAATDTASRPALHLTAPSADHGTAFSDFAALGPVSRPMTFENEKENEHANEDKDNGLGLGLNAASTATQDHSSSNRYSALSGAGQTGGSASVIGGPTSAPSIRSFSGRSALTSGTTGTYGRKDLKGLLQSIDVGGDGEEGERGSRAGAGVLAGVAAPPY